jgi:hypothetical protein
LKRQRNRCWLGSREALSFCLARFNALLDQIRHRRLRSLAALN